MPRQSYVTENNTALLLDINGAIGPAVQDYVERGIASAAKEGAKLVILRIDTPGGLETSMRGINKAILASSIPVAAYVAPSGARAASAGTFIVYASHIAAMAPGTNLGAASPVAIGSEFGSKEPDSKDLKANVNADLDTHEKKAKEDAAAYIRSLAKLRGRNIDWAEKAVLEAVSISSDEALKLGVIDMIANNETELLKLMNGKVVTVLGKPETLKTAELNIKPMKADWRFDFLASITNPTVAYILLLIGIYGLFFEFSSPGFVLPGVAGAICLLLALYAFQLLPINYVGLALLILGVACMIFEIYISSFGILGIGGAISFIIGSILLMDTESENYKIAWQAILMMSIVTIAFFLVVFNLAIRSLRKKVVTGSEGLIGEIGEVISIKKSDDTENLKQKEITVRVHGELWTAKAEVSVVIGQQIRVKALSGLLLLIEPVSTEHLKQQIQQNQNNPINLR